jgi:MFS family permease
VKSLGPALEVRDYRLWWLALLGMGISLQMLEVAIGWEVYAQHRSALDLGWIGLAEFVPLFALALPAGQLADRVPRRLIFAGSLLARAMPPTLVGPELLQSAMTLRSVATQSAQVVGPALGGLLYGTSPSLV